MGLFTGDTSRAYAEQQMPARATGPGPWGAAIRYWLPRKNMSQADLVRKTGIRKNTISRATRGMPVTTATIAAIAEALDEPIEVVLVSPEWMDRQDAQKRVIQDAVERALRAFTPPSVGVLRDSFRAAEHLVRNIEESDSQGAPQQNKKPDVKPKRREK